MFRQIFATAVAAALLSGCGGADSTQPRVAMSIQLSHAHVQMEEGQSVTVTATIIDQQGVAFTAPPPGYEITWASGSPEIVSVAGGVITAQAPGNALVVLSAGNLAPAVVEVQVTARVRVPTYLAVALPGGGWIQSHAIELDGPGQTAAFTVVFLDQHYIRFDTAPVGYLVTWETVNPGVATAAAGNVTATGVGLTWIAARSGTLSAAVIQVSVTAAARLSFDYEGDRTGTVSIDRIVGPLVWGQDWSWAASFYDTESETQDIIAQRVREDGRFDLLWVWVDGRATEPRTTSVAAGDGWLILGYNPATASDEGGYEVVSGSFTFSSVSPHRLAGSFALKLAEEDSGAALDVTDGEFDLPIVDESVPIVLGGSWSQILQVLADGRQIVHHPGIRRSGR
jgi:hypothetical protein